MVPNCVSVYTFFSIFFLTNINLHSDFIYMRINVSTPIIYPYVISFNYHNTINQSLLSMLEHATLKPYQRRRLLDALFL